MSQQFLEIISQAFAAGETKIFQVSGQYFELLDAPYPVNVRLTDRTGAVRGLMSAAEASFFMRSTDFETIELVSPNAQTIRFMYGSAEAGTRRSTGLVQVVDGDKARALAASLYSGGVAIGAVVGQFPYVQLWNPPASGRNLVVPACNLSSSVAGMGIIGFSTAQRATDATASAARNKRLQSAIGVAQLRVETNASGGSNGFYTAQVLALTTFPWRPTGPIIVPPGVGLEAYINVVNTTFSAAYEWYEEVV